MVAYHVVTERPMAEGQTIIFDQNHHSGVYRRVYDREDLVKDIYAHPEKYEDDALEHHTAVALRELALEEIRTAEFPEYPSRLACLYVSEDLERARHWGNFFASLGRPTWHIVKLSIDGPVFRGDATKCFRGTKNKEENLRLARLYWENAPRLDGEEEILEILAAGKITVLEIVEEIQANIPEHGESR